MRAHVKNPGFSHPLDSFSVPLLNSNNPPQTETKPLKVQTKLPETDSSDTKDDKNKKSSLQQSSLFGKESNYRQDLERTKYYLAQIMVKHAINPQELFQNEKKDPYSLTISEMTTQIQNKIDDLNATIESKLDKRKMSYRAASALGCATVGGAVGSAGAAAVVSLPGTVVVATGCIGGSLCIGAAWAEKFTVCGSEPRLQAADFCCRDVVMCGKNLFPSGATYTLVAKIGGLAGCITGAIHGWRHPEKLYDKCNPDIESKIQPAVEFKDLLVKLIEPLKKLKQAVDRELVYDKDLVQPIFDVFSNQTKLSPRIVQI